MVLTTSPEVVFHTLMVASHDAETTRPASSVVGVPSAVKKVDSSLRRTHNDETQPV